MSSGTKICLQAQISVEGQGIARDTLCPQCKDADFIGYKLSSCTNSEVKKVYIKA
jgi:hypothetical protein